MAMFGVEFLKIIKSKKPMIVRFVTYNIKKVIKGILVKLRNNYYTRVLSKF